MQLADSEMVPSCPKYVSQFSTIYPKEFQSYSVLKETRLWYNKKSETSRVQYIHSFSFEDLGTIHSSFFPSGELRSKLKISSLVNPSDYIWIWKL